MRAIKIDPVAKTITEIELAQNPNETLQELYDLIGCDLVELVQLDRGIIMAIDEEGKLKEIKGGFTFLGWGTVIAGTGIVLGGNSSKLKALQENLASFEMMTEWVDAADVPPPGAFIPSFQPHLMQKSEKCDFMLGKTPNFVIFLRKILRNLFYVSIIILLGISKIFILYRRNFHVQRSSRKYGTYHYPRSGRGFYQ